MSTSVIISAARTPIASFQGGLSKVKASDLGAIAIREAIVRAGIAAGDVEEVIMGCVLPAGQGQNPARQASLAAGIPNSVEAITINRVCGSGLRAVMLADQLIRSGDSDIIVAGGMESMTRAPYLLPEARSGMRLGDSKAVDGMVFDGLWDIHSNQHMGSCAELCADKYGFTREAQDEFTIASYKKAQEAIKSGAFRDEIVAVPVPEKKGAPTIFDTDEEPGRADFEKMKRLKPCFKEGGTITAANSSSISDGAAALVLMSEDRAKKAGLGPMARVLAHASFAHDPVWFTTAPVGAIKAVLAKAKLNIEDIDIFEINEAFSAVTMAAIKEFSIDPKKVNIHGGAAALGHPIGASGARILTTLIYAMKHKGLKRGLATLCNGGGGATAVIVELP